MNSILWFRKGLRLHDNLALLEAIKGEVKNFYPVFVLDPHFMDSSRIGENRMRFLLQTLRDLDSNLRKKGSRLFVLKGKPVEVFPSVFKRWHIQKIAWEKDTEPYAIIRDKTIEKLAKENKIDVVITFGHTLFDLDALLKKNNGKPPMTYKGFQTLMTKAGMPQRPKDAPDQLPPYEMTKEDQPNEKSENWLENYSVPTLGCLPTYPAEEDVPEIPYKGGETVALERMEKYLSFKKQVLTFSKPETNAASSEYPIVLSLFFLIW
jgi:cryptochrome